MFSHVAMVTYPLIESCAMVSGLLTVSLVQVVHSSLWWFNCSIYLKTPVVVRHAIRDTVTLLERTRCSEDDPYVVKEPQL